MNNINYPTPDDMRPVKPPGLRGDWVESATTLRLRQRIIELEEEVERLNGAIAKHIEGLLHDTRPR